MRCRGLIEYNIRKIVITFIFILLLNLEKIIFLHENNHPMTSWMAIIRYRVRKNRKYSNYMIDKVVNHLEKYNDIPLPTVDKWLYLLLFNRRSTTGSYSYLHTNTNLYYYKLIPL